MSRDVRSSARGIRPGRDIRPARGIRPSRRAGAYSADHGFTLIEVLVALAIVAIGMAAVLGALTSSANTVIYMKDKTLAQWIALNHIAEQRLLPQMPPQGKTNGDLEYAGQKWHWRQVTVPTAVQGMIRMDVMVRPADIKADDDHGWYVTLSAIEGDAVSAPRGDIPLWGSGTTVPTPGGVNGTGNGANNGTTGTTTNGTGTTPSGGNKTTTTR
ncbi:MAG TPA: type II secretion system minor pseudopilin GspI [Steroidobacteraceae bacterium]|nr:type II secretion system minor pseudopilin GspI [Steroidobacteraceae bacterium]